MIAGGSDMTPRVRSDGLSPTAALAEFAASLRYVDLPDQVADKAKACFLDWLVVTMLGSRHPTADAVEASVARLKGLGNHATIIGRGRRAMPVFAALANGITSHVLDYDDMHVAMNGHPGVAVFPALLAIVESERLGGEALLRGFAVGAEVCCRLGLAMSPGHYDVGWHATSTIGIIGAAAAIGNVLALDPKSICRAISLATTQASGMQCMFGTQGKPFNIGHASTGAILAVQFARSGLDAAAEPLVGDRGYAALYGGADDRVASELRRLGDPFLMADTVLKAYPSCYSTYAPIEAAMQLSPDTSERVGAVDAIRVRVSPMAASVAGISQPETSSAARFSIAYCVVRSLIDGRITSSSFDDRVLKHPSTGALLPRVLLETDATIRHDERRASVFVQFSDGHSISADADVVSGGTTKSQGDWDLINTKLAELPCRASWRSALTSAVKDLETVSDMRSFGHEFFPLGSAAIESKAERKGPEDAPSHDGHSEIEERRRCPMQT